MFPTKKLVWFLLLGLFVTVTAWGETLDDPDYLGTSKEESSSPALGVPPFISDFTAGPSFFTRSYMSGYLNTADSHTLPQGMWKAGVVNLVNYWSYKVFGSQVDNNYLDTIFMWGFGLYKGIEANMALPVRYYYNSQLDNQGVDLVNPFSVYDSSLSLKGVFRGDIAAAGLGITQSFPVGYHEKGFGHNEFITKIMGIFSLTPFKGFSIDINGSYYFGGDGPGKRTFAFEGFTFNIGTSLELKGGFALYAQIEYWNPFVPPGGKNDRLSAALGVRIQTTKSGAVFFSFGFTLKSPELAPELANLPVVSYKEDGYFYIGINFVDHW